MQNSTSTIRFAGDVSIKEIQLNSLNGQVANITNQVSSIEIYEDLFSPFMTLSIVVVESLDYLNLFPFVGEEYLDLDIETPSIGKPIKGRFYVYKMSDRVYTKERQVSYVIKAISEEFLTDVNTKISKAFSGNITESVSRLMGKEGLKTNKKTNIEKTINSTKIVSNYWTPVVCLNELAAGAMNLNHSPSYMFFENRNGLNFLSVDSLINQKTFQHFTKDNYTRSTRDDGVDSIKNPEEDYKRILEIDIPTVTNYIDETQGGRLKSRLITHDILTKKYTVKDYSIKKDPLPQTLLNPAPSYSKYSAANAAGAQLVMPKYYGNFNNFSDVTNTKVIQRRMSFFENLNKFKLNVTVYGRTDYTIGQVYDLTLPRTSPITKSDNENRDMMMSGRYLVTAISHMITRENHICNMELVKNSVLVNLNNT